MERDWRGARAVERDWRGRGREGARREGSQVVHLQLACEIEIRTEADK